MPNLTVNRTPVHVLVFGEHLVGAPVTFNVRPREHTP